VFIPALCFIGGLVAMGRTKPQTAVRKLVALGPRTGLVYSVEDLAEVGTVIVRAPGNQAIAQFVRASVRQPGAHGLVYQHGQGRPDVLDAIRRDFGVEMQRPAVAPKTEPKAAAAAGAGKSTP
jgi:hypothetical protein